MFFIESNRYFFIEITKRLTIDPLKRYNFIERRGKGVPEGQLMETRVSQATFWRLPGYLRFLETCKERGVETITSTVIADSLCLNSIQVRKDLATVASVQGKPKTGFRVDDLIRDLNKFLCYDNVSEAVIVGVGGLGSALVGYTGFEAYGLRITAAFDADAGVVGRKIGSLTVRPVTELAEFVRAHRIEMGIVTVPKSAAQTVCDFMIAAGIRAIWNFAPTHLVTPLGVTVRNEEMAAGLAYLAKSLEHRDASDD